MNDKGDFYIGNTKISSASGEQVTFDIPIPTVTGEDPNRSSVVFDEVIVKERLLVEGGSSGQILSQFDGPVTFNGTVRLNKKLTLEAHLDAQTIKVRDDTDSTSCTTGALQVKGGVGIAKKVNICGDTKIHNGTDTTSETTGALVVTGGVGIGKNLWVKSDLRVEGNATLDGNVILGNAAGDTVTFNADVNSNILPSTNGSKTLGNVGNRWQVFASTGSFSGIVNISNTTASTDKTNGALVVAGGAAIGGDLNVGADITAYAASDKRLKDNITPISNALDKVLSISGNTFNWNSASSKEGKGDTGVIAQEIEALDLPGVTTIRDDGTHAVAYEKLVPLLIEAIKELSTKVDALS